MLNHCIRTSAFCTCAILPTMHEQQTRMVSLGKFGEGSNSQTLSTTNITRHSNTAEHSTFCTKMKIRLFSTVCVCGAVIVLVAGRSDSHLGSKASAALLVPLSNVGAFVQRRTHSTLTPVISFALHLGHCRTFNIRLFITVQSKLL